MFVGRDLRNRWLLVPGVADGIQQVVGRRDAIGAIDDRAVLADDEDGAVDRVAVFPGMPRYRFQRAVFAVHSVETVVDQQIERQLQMDLEALVAVEVVTADAEWNGIEISIGVDCPANRGQLVRSPRGEVFRIEDQQHPVGAEVVGEGDRGSAGALEREVDRWIPNMWSWQRLIGHARILYAHPASSPQRESCKSPSLNLERGAPRALTARFTAPAACAPTRPEHRASWLDRPPPG